MQRTALLQMINTELLAQLYQFCYARTACSHEAEELCSDILYAVVLACNKDKEMNNPLAYFWRVARNVYADHCEKRHINAEYSVTSDPQTLLMCVADADGNDIVTIETDKQLLRDIFRKISNLSRAYREVMIGFYLDGKSTAQLSAELCVSETAIRQRLFSARNDIRNEVKKMNNTTAIQKPTALQNISWTIWGTGSSGTGDPRDVCERQLSKHVIWLCRNKPNTARAISDELGVPMTYVEEELDIQLHGANGKYGTLRKTDSGKYVTNFIFLDENEIRQAQRLYTDNIGLVCDVVSSYIEKHRTEYLAFPYINKKPTFNLILWQQLSSMAYILSDLVGDKLKNKYLSDIQIAKRPFTIFAYRNYDGAKKWGGGHDAISSNEICNYRFVQIDNIYVGRIKPHFHCSHNISNDAKLRLAIMAVDGIKADKLSADEKEFAAKAIECGYIYRDGNMLYTKFLVHRQEDDSRLFSLNYGMQKEFDEAAEKIAAELAAFIRKIIPEHLLGDYMHVNGLANLPVFDTLVEKLIEKGLLTPPENGIGAEGIWMSVTK